METTWKCYDCGKLWERSEQLPTLAGCPDCGSHRIDIIGV